MEEKKRKYRKKKKNYKKNEGDTSDPEYLMHK